MFFSLNRWLFLAGISLFSFHQGSDTELEALSYSVSLHNTDAIPVNPETLKKPRNIIFLIGDGMGLTQVSAGMFSNGNTLNLERCPIMD